jgi:heat shock protein HtpX
MTSTLKTAALLALLDALFMAVGLFIGHVTGLIVAAIVALLMNGISYWKSDRIAVAAAGAREVSPQEAPELHSIVEELCRDAGLPKPRIYVSPDPSPNAFATGRNPEHAAVCCTVGILQLCDARELRGVLAHELSHVRNRDILTATVAATLAAGIALIAQFAQYMVWFGLGRDERDEGAAILGTLVVAILAAPAAALIQLAISRAREYEADHSGAEMSHDPLALRDALYKLEMRTQQVPMHVAPAFAPLYIVNPFGRSRASLSALFSTHPPLEDRIRRLEAMANAPH